MSGYAGYDEATYRAILAAWGSGRMVGSIKPVCRAYVRTVRLGRAFRQVGLDEVHGIVPGLPRGARRVWKGVWRVKDAWTPLPNVLDFNGDQDFDENGVQQATIQIDNLYVKPETGVSGTFHRFVRGFFSPWRGFKPSGRQATADAIDPAWFDRLHDKSTQIMVVAGYGDDVVPIFSGLINDVDLTSRPDRITILARDVGQVPTDQQCFANAKIAHVRDPITFADRSDAYKETEVALGAEASSHENEYPPRFAIDGDEDSHWRSQGRDSKDAVQWCEIAVPNGRYHKIKLDARYANMVCWIAIKARDKQAPGGNGAHKIGGEPYADGEWVDEGQGEVEGTPFVKYVGQVRGKEQTIALPDQGYVLGDDSRIRLYFSNLPLVGKGPEAGHRAAVTELRALKARLPKDIEEQEWILVDDLSDVVKMVFQWCGINEFEVETTGVRLKEPVVFNRGNFLVEILRNAAEQVNYVLYFKPPYEFDENDLGPPESGFEESIGVGVFRQNQAMRRERDTLERIEMVHEDRTLRGINMKLTDEPKAYNIRVRGKEAKKKKGGRVLSGDRTLRYMYVYRPPWSRDEHPGGNWPDNDRDEFRNGNIKKYVVHHDPKLKSVDECKIAAMFIAFAQSLKAYQGQIEMPALPTVHLDHQIGVFDTGTGLSSRIWVALRGLHFRSGENAAFNMTLGGSLLDAPDTVVIREELHKALKKKNYDPGLSQNELDRFGDVYRNT